MHLDARIFSGQQGSHNPFGQVNSEKKSRAIRSLEDGFAYIEQVVSDACKSANVQVIREALQFASNVVQNTHAASAAKQMAERLDGRLSIDLQKRFPIAKERSAVLQRDLTKLLRNHKERALSEIEERRIKNLRRNAMGKMIASNYVGQVAVTESRLKERWGDSIYYLTPDGAAYLTLASNLAHPEWVRSFSQPPNGLTHMEHEIQVVNAFRALDRFQPKHDYQVKRLQLNANISGQRSIRKKDHYYPDILVEVEKNGHTKSIAIEIDLGTHPARKTEQRTSLAIPLIYVCKDELWAERRLSESTYSSMIPKLFTSCDRLAAGGIFGAGYISHTKRSFCACSKLVRCEIGKGSVVLRDRLGCPCINSLFCTPEELSPTVRPDPRPAHRPPVRHAVPAARPPQKKHPVGPPPANNHFSIWIWLLGTGLEGLWFLIEAFFNLLMACIKCIPGLIRHLIRVLTSPYLWASLGLLGMIFIVWHRELLPVIIQVFDFIHRLLVVL